MVCARPQCMVPAHNPHARILLTSQTVPSVRPQVSACKSDSIMCMYETLTSRDYWKNIMYCEASINVREKIPSAPAPWPPIPRCLTPPVGERGERGERGVEVLRGDEQLVSAGRRQASLDAVLWAVIACSPHHPRPAIVFFSQGGQVDIIRCAHIT